MKRAVVVGGGIGGLLAARVLRQCGAREVLLVDADPQYSLGSVRPGVPQGTQLHVLLHMGQQLIEHWMPGIGAELVASGAVRSTIGDSAAMVVDGRSFPGDGTESLLGVSRPHLEDTVRRRVLADSGVRHVNARVTGLFLTRGRVSGVRLAAGGSLDGSDLVVDATGRAGRLDDWLRRSGRPGVAKQRIRLGLGYATAFFARDDGDDLDGLRVVHSLRTAVTGGPGVAAIVACEGNRWGVMTSGYGVHRPRADAAEFAARCAQDPWPHFARVVTRCRPLGDVRIHHFSGQIRRDWHRHPGLPPGVLPLGDSVASLNPVYGQGMTAAALHASALAAWLRSGPDLRAPAHRYLQYLRVLTDAVWQATATQDLQLPHVTGDRPRDYLLLRMMGPVVRRAALCDPVVTREFLRVTGLRSHPSALASPAILLRCVASLLRTPR